MANDMTPCTVKIVTAFDGITKTMAGTLTCGLPAVEEWDDEVISWVNTAWMDYQITGKTICQHHLDMCPEP